MPATTELTKMILHEIKFTKKRKIIQHQGQCILLAPFYFMIYIIIQHLYFEMFNEKENA